jgi:hypothetical protein
VVQRGFAPDTSNVSQPGQEIVYIKNENSHKDAQIANGKVETILNGLAKGYRSVWWKPKTI